jgi:hypothetical protein
MRDLHRDGSQDALIGPGAAVGLVGAEFSERAEEARKLGPKLRGIVTPPPVANRDRVIQVFGSRSANQSRKFLRANAAVI